jgi:hypothetical protein
MRRAGAIAPPCIPARERKRERVVIRRILAPHVQSSGWAPRRRIQPQRQVWLSCLSVMRVLRKQSSMSGARPRRAPAPIHAKSA